MRAQMFQLYFPLQTKNYEQTNIFHIYVNIWINIHLKSFIEYQCFLNLLTSCLTIVKLSELHKIK